MRPTAVVPLLLLACTAPLSAQDSGVSAEEAPASAQEAPLVYIDPGHGGEQAGVVVDEIQEKDHVLRWGFLVAAAFAEAGYETRMSRTGDETLTFAERLEDAKAVGADLFLSLHMTRNEEDPQDWGTEIFLAEELPASVAAAEAVAASLESLGARVALIGQPWDVLKTEEFPTLMVELGHLTHPVERRLLLSRDYWERTAEALVDAADRILEGR